MSSYHWGGRCVGRIAWAEPKFSDARSGHFSVAGYKVLETKQSGGTCVSQHDEESTVSHLDITCS